MENEDIRNDAFYNLLEIIRDRKIQVIIGFLSVFTIVIIGIFLMPPVYKASTKIYIIPPAIPKVAAPYFVDIGSVRSFVSNQEEIIKTRLIYEKVVKKLYLYEIEEAPSYLGKFKNMFSQVNPDPLEKAINGLYRNTSVRLIRGTNIIEIAAYSKSSKGVAVIANTLAGTYIDYANNLLFNKAQKAYGAIATQSEIARNELAKSQKVLNEFRTRNNVISYITIGDERAILRDKLTEYDIEYQEVQTEIKEMAKGKFGADYQVQPNDSPRIKELKARAKNRLNAMKSKQNNVSKQIQILKSKIAKLSTTQYELAKITQDVNNDEREYLMLKKNLGDASILKASEMYGGSIKLIDPAFPPPYPDKKKKKILLVIGFIVSVLFGLGMAFIAEYRDDSFKNREETEKYLRLPVLATISPITKKMRKDGQKG